jgi:hypothetical protein
MEVSMFASVENAKQRRYKVFCNGEILGHCFAADEELGVALCYAEDENGLCFKNPEKPSEIKKVLIQGKIEIKEVF